jgi:hypothetical protein
MIKQREMNQEKIRIRFVELFEEYIKSKGKNTSAMKDIPKEYDDIIDLLDETLNCSIGIMDAIIKKQIKDKREEDAIVNEILAELKGKSYLGMMPEESQDSKTDKEDGNDEDNSEDDDEE